MAGLSNCWRIVHRVTMTNQNHNGKTNGSEPGNTLTEVRQVSPAAIASLKDSIEQLARRYLTRIDEVIAADPNLNKQEVTIIERIAWYNLHTVSDIAGNGQFMPLSTASWIVSSLVEKGYLERRPHATDRRVTMLYLTGPGRSVLKQLDRMYQAISEAILRGLDEQETEIVLRAMERVSQQEGDPS